MEQRPHDSKNSPGATGPAASAADPVTATPARRHRRRPAHATPSPVPPTSASPTNASPTTDEAPGATASAPAEPAASAARGTRRRARATTPRLVAPPRAEPTESVPEVASAPESAQSEAAPPEHAAIAMPAAPGDHLSPAEPAVLVGVAPVGAAAPALDPVPAPTPVPARRYRFDRPAAHAGTPARVPARPERLSVVSPAPIGTNGAPERSLAAAESATGPAEESGGDLADSAPEVAPAPLGGETPGLTDTPADQDLLVLATVDTDGPTRIESLAASEVGDGQEPGHESTEVDAAGGDHEANGEELGEVTSTGRRRRRRRRGNGSAAGIRHLDAILADEHDEAEHESPPTRNGGRGSAAAHEPPEPEETSPTDLFGHTGPARVSPRAASAAHSASPPDQPYELYGPYQPEPWSIANPYQQIGLDQSPFGAPEPNTARGFGPQPHGVAGPAPDRPERVGRGTRGERATDLPPMSANQLSATVTHAIQQQTDRLLTELRHTPASPAMTVTFPPLPSTERVGVFVDVANLLYSSRSLRVGLDFGRLLEFLRGGRRLIRAQAYAPTNPEPRAEQQFLTVVKGVGYRITTKNYKTFSSGAKKADLDLDLCMDIVRLVEARALDTVVLVSGDSDFLPLLEYCSDHGVRVEVAAFEDAAAAILRQSCDLFINLSLVEDIRA